MFSQSGVAAVPIFTNNCLRLLSYTISPGAGLAIAMTVALSIRGINNPRDVLLISSCADEFGDVVPIPTLCACPTRATSKKTVNCNRA